MSCSTPLLFQPTINPWSPIECLLCCCYSFTIIAKIYYISLTELEETSFSITLSTITFMCWKFFDYDHTGLLIKFSLVYSNNVHKTGRHLPNIVLTLFLFQSITIMVLPKDVMWIWIYLQILNKVASSSAITYDIYPIIIFFLSERRGSFKQFPALWATGHRIDFKPRTRNSVHKHFSAKTPTENYEYVLLISSRLNIA